MKILLKVKAEREVILKDTLSRFKEKPADAIRIAKKVLTGEPDLIFKFTNDYWFEVEAVALTADSTEDELFGTFIESPEKFFYYIFDDGEDDFVKGTDEIPRESSYPKGIIYTY